MIVTKDIEQILVQDLSRIMDVSQIFTGDDYPEGEITEERIVIRAKNLTPHTYFKKCFVEVNWCVPDIGNAPDSIRLQKVERQMVEYLSSIGEYDESTYRYEVNSHQSLKGDLKYHYINVRLLFEILNVL